MFGSKECPVCSAEVNDRMGHILSLGLSPMVCENCHAKLESTVLSRITMVFVFSSITLLDAFKASDTVIEVTIAAMIILILVSAKSFHIYSLWGKGIITRIALNLTIFVSFIVLLA